MANNSMNSDWKMVRRFAMQLFPAGYAERYARTMHGAYVVFGS